MVSGKDIIQIHFCYYSVYLRVFHESLYLTFSFGFEGRMWDLIVSVPDHCLSFHFAFRIRNPIVKLSQQRF